MRRERTAWAWMAIAALLPAGCGESAGPESRPAASTAPDLGPFDAEEGVRDIMDAKVVHSSNLLRGIAVADHALIEHHAEALAWLSTRAEFRVHDSPAYSALNEQFRGVAERLADDARVEDIESASLAYLELTQSCLNCHAYLRREGLTRGMPGAVSLAPSP